MKLYQDETFRILAFYHVALSEPLYAITWKDTGRQVSRTGGFFSEQGAIDYIKENRQKMIDALFEETVL